MKLLVNGEAFEVEVLERGIHDVTFSVAGRTYKVEHLRETAGTAPGEGRAAAPAAQAAAWESSGGGGVSAPIPGVVVAVLVAKGQAVSAGEVLLRLEAMKMENNIFAPCAGIVGEIYVTTGQEVADGQPLLEIKPGGSEKPAA